jgi:hypothetical protein
MERRMSSVRLWAKLRNFLPSPELAVQETSVPSLLGALARLV